MDSMLKICRSALSVASDVLDYVCQLSMGDGKLVNICACPVHARGDDGVYFDIKASSGETTGVTSSSSSGKMSTYALSNPAYHLPRT